MLRVRFQAGIVNFRYPGVLLQHFCKCHCILVVPFNPQFQGLHASQHEVGRVRIDDASKHIVHLLHFGDNIFSSTNRTCEHVIVSSEVFGGRVNHNICAQLDRTLIDGCAECTVDADQCPFLVAHARHKRYIDTSQVRVGWRFREVQADFVCVKGFLERLDVSWIDDRGRDSHFGKHRLDKLSRPAVAIRGGDDVSAGGHQGHEHGGGGVHS
mmetsp:Transcript_42/g.363  ORF Transcript_42/g.363 Transcript_42/m.363 type:complete len:212 (-) Transcript_42:505-1140(-)